MQHVTARKLYIGIWLLLISVLILMECGTTDLNRFVRRGELKENELRSIHTRFRREMYQMWQGTSGLQKISWEKRGDKEASLSRLF